MNNEFSESLFGTGKTNVTRQSFIFFSFFLFFYYILGHDLY